MSRTPFGQSFSRRNVLTSLAAIPAVALLAACSDSGEQAKAADVKPADPATPAKPATPAAVQVPEAQGTVDMAELLKPGALPDKQLGKDDAKVTIVEYASMTCPHCAHFAETTFPDLKTKYIDTGKARYILREFPFDPSAEAGFMLARCAKDNYFPMVDVLFRQQANWVGVSNTKDALLQISKLAGFTQESFEACLTDQKLLDDVRSVQKRGANEFKVDSTPTFFINGKTYKGAMSIEEMSAIIDPLL
ncbi:MULTISPECIES: DsbA family protein [unclassified Mesorhizobium]|uniref:DsbA family protein n=1 Tax=unclassified Mesorhizobium TaxID=325217 RepID=UPI000F758885|nr:MULTISPECIES: DsbA family protein [unclassified Mesorhizobium]RUX00055.1 DsbA family protein [Mesorhizobium sp. M8A.F.Ca.ET.059.01.1.1]TGR37815.1 DsbA family protein [bacterium M00.F.Ca.ET.199.01.1.1]TGU23455.1 DsbA family protein [bacterium M00.F.Ca.ET.156.01.1.1]TGU94013.1 DsbA family protein [Mesorhizobium sp. M00.F.Ca.ET.151.01.1.1]TGV56789.1 DsbA family protein [bacterium M00.F.Ca.ET.141.01.1.1]TGV90805.1 DsbA family protein [Mesorhizobium sp. M00.F.Ca.ET.149.01.1.1]